MTYQSDHTEVADMNMEAIQKVAVSYQGSVVSADQTQNVTQATVQMPERTAAAAQQQKVTAKEESDRAEKNKDRDKDKKQISEKVSDSSLKKAVEDINRNSSNTEAIFGYHEGTNRVTIKIIDKDTKEVKREYPAEETLDMIQKIWEMAGLMVDEKR